MGGLRLGQFMLLEGGWGVGLVAKQISTYSDWH
jgi:hypothetical protein